MKNFLNKINTSILLLLSVLLATSCLKENNDYQDNEDQLIKTYITTNSGYHLLNSGIYYKSESEGTGDTVSSWSDLVIISYKATNLETNKVFDTSIKSLATELSITNNTFLKTDGPLKIALTGENGFYAPGVSYGLLNMKEGGKASMVVPGYLALGSYTPLVFDVDLIKVIKNPKTFESEQISHYLANDSIKLTLNDSIDGLFYVNQTEGTGNLPVDGDSVKIKYSLHLLPYYDENLFDIPQKTLQTAQKISIKLGTTSLIEGFSKAVKQMKLGGKATVVIPYQYAYKSSVMIEFNTVSEIYQLTIPQYSTLIYDLEILEVKK